ncbi:uncharacterized protein PAN0_012c4468 [Moesziomyces antarcticus]|uniref:Uncharacterized protein n=2 Tax=Pseudozyma antarctica TaxID=84753 RepID=A0A081CHV0_PSEA2|nr:uncharacterized protein PAN0_012c4468 [Moesziomyces antarcticus]GAK66246.1 hypothetical protein PAN0_012c4468 [Moesziomyces antarcticus]SPO48561.1 uncharacterized protein PSANT_06252 [Moesziomyces antarcticus]
MLSIPNAMWMDSMTFASDLPRRQAKATRRVSPRFKQTRGETNTSTPSPRSAQPGSSTALLCAAARSNFKPECPETRPLSATRLSERASERLGAERLSGSLAPRDICEAGGAKRVCAGGRASLGSRDWKRATSDSSPDALSSPKRSFLRSPSVLLAAGPP